MEEFQYFNIASKVLRIEQDEKKSVQQEMGDSGITTAPPFTALATFRFNLRVENDFLGSSSESFGATQFLSPIAVTPQFPATAHHTATIWITG